MNIHKPLSFWHFASIGNVKVGRYADSHESFLQTAHGRRQLFEVREYHVHIKSAGESLFDGMFHPMQTDGACGFLSDTPPLFDFMMSLL